MKVKFTADAIKRDEKGAINFSAKRGDMLELADDQAQRWIRRNMALPLDEAQAREKAEADKRAESEPAQDDEPKKAKKQK